MELSSAEQQMISLLRKNHGSDFVLTITREGLQWHIRLEDRHTGVVGDGHGLGFDRAWDNVADNRMRR
jgi:hypothetical protein